MSVERAFFRYLEKPTGRRLGNVVKLVLPEVWGLAVQLSGNEEDARDLCQDLFLSLLLYPPASDSVRSPRGYLCSRVVTLASNQRRAARRRRQHERESLRRVAEAESLPVEELEALREAVESLPEKLQTVVELRYLASRTNKQIASALEISERSVVGYLTRAREVLRKRLGSSAFAVLGQGAFVEACAPPPDLLPTLLRIARHGSVLGTATSVTTTAGLAAMKKVLVCSSIALLILVGTVALVMIQPPPGAPVSSPELAVLEPVDGSSLSALEPVDRSSPFAALPSDTEHRLDLTVVWEGTESRVGGASTRLRFGQERAQTAEAVCDDQGRAELTYRAESGEGQLEVWLGDVVRMERTVPLPGGPLQVSLPLVFVVSGRISDSLSGEPIPGAVIRYGKDESILADKQAEYRLRREMGRHSLTASAEGYVRSRKTANVTEPGKTVVDFKLDPLAEILVQVVDTKGTPVGGVGVTPSEAEYEGRYDPRDTARTDQNGEARILRNSRFGAARPRLLVKKNGFAVAGIGDLLEEENGTRWVEITVERLDENVRVVQGRVTDLDGNPLPGAFVTWNDGSIQFGPGGARRKEAVASDAVGRYRLEFRHREWTFNFAAHFEGFAPAWRQSVRSGTAPEPATLDFVLKPGHAIEGQVVDEEGKSLEGVQVEVRTRLHRNLHDILASVPHISVTDDRGSFVLQDLSEGPLTVDLSKSGWSSWRVPGVKVDEYRVFSLWRLGVVRGRVLRAETREPVRSFTVKIENGPRYSTDRKTIGETFDSSEGRFELRRLYRSGKEEELFTLKIEADGYAHTLLRNVEPQLPLEAEEHVVLLSEGQEVVGMVVDSVTGEPLVDVKVYAGIPRHMEYVWNDRRPWLKDGSVMVQTDESGTFRLQNGEPHTLFLHLDGYRRLVIRTGEISQYRNGEGDLKIELASGESVFVTVVSPESGEQPKSLSLLRLREGGDPGEPPKRDLYGIKDLSREANFLWNDLSPGRYLIALHQMTPDGAWLASTVFQEFTLGEAEHRSIRAGENLGSLRFHGRIIDTMGQPLVNSRLILNPLFDWEYVEFEGHTSGSKKAEFSIPHLKPGRYSVTVTRYVHGKLVRHSLESIELKADAERDLVVVIPE